MPKSRVSLQATVSSVVVFRPYLMVSLNQATLGQPSNVQNQFPPFSIILEQESSSRSTAATSKLLLLNHKILIILILLCTALEIHL